MLDQESFKHLVADQIGIDLNYYNITLTNLGDTIYRIDLSIGNYNANTVVPVLNADQARNVAVCFSKCIKKWESEVEEQQKRNCRFEKIDQILEKYGFTEVDLNRKKVKVFFHGKVAVMESWKASKLAAELTVIDPYLRLIVQDAEE